MYIDKEKVNRLRIGQSKIPYGWENLQSSQNRLPLDRDDAFNSAAKNERDLGVFSTTGLRNGLRTHSSTSWTRT